MGYLFLFALLTAITACSGSRSRRYTNVVVVPAAEKNVTEATIKYCFHYTWLKDMNNETFLQYVNKTCADKYALVRPRPLCVDPMIVTDNGEEPDINWLVANSYKAVTCRMYDGYTCAKYTYYFNGEVQNITRYCTKITVNEVSMSSGCISSSNGAHSTEVCACKGMIGKIPCNSSKMLKFSSIWFVFLAASVTFIQTVLINGNIVDLL